MAVKVIDKQCNICGRYFPVFIEEKTGEILNKCFYTEIRKNIFLKWWYVINKNIEVENIEFKNTLWKILGFTKIQREIIYFIWNIIFGWSKIEFWECNICCKN